jgi:NAD(P)-dependent dehydrogenase (short-subunit alcohol dehydrogenase family)
VILELLGIKLGRLLVDDVAEKLAWLGASIDAEANAKHAQLISTTESRVAVYMLPTDKELMIARHTLSLLSKRPANSTQRERDVSCWSFLRMAHLAEPLMKDGGTLFTMTYCGSQMVVENYNIMGVAKAALECAVRYIAAEVGPKGIRVHAISPGPLATGAASEIPEFDELLAKALAKAPARSLVSIDDVGKAVAFLALDGAKLMTGDTLYIRWRLSYH